MKKCKSKTRKKKLPRYDLGTMKPIDLGYQKAREIGGFHAKVDQGQDISGETRAVRESILPNALTTTLNYGTQVANNLKEGPVFNTGTNTPDPGRTTGVPILDADRNTLPQKGMHMELPSTLTPSAPVNTVPQMSIPGFQSSSSALTGSPFQQAMQSSLSGTGFNTAGDAFSASLSAIPQGGFHLSEDALKAANQQALQNATETAAKQGAKSGLGNAMNVGGRALSVIGAAKGLYDMGSQIANAGDHRSAKDMAATSGKQYYTTDRGNSYTNYTGVNAGREMAYERAMKNAKQTNFFLTSTGTGASIGSLFPGWGTAIGAIGGALIGGLGSLLGLGDNRKKVEELTRRVNDNFANFNRQGEAVAKSKDIAAEFADRTASAKDGKSAYGPMKYRNGKEDIDVLQGPNGYAIGKPTSLLAPGEYTYDPVNMTGSKVTGKGHEDTEPSYIEPNDQNIVFSDHLKIGNKSIAKHAAPMIKEMEWLNKVIQKAGSAEGIQEAQQQLQIQQAQQRQQQLNEQLVQLSELQNVKRAEKEMGSYKCGKKPGYDDGKSRSKDSLAPSWFDYGLASLPHLASLVSSNDSYHRAKHASTYAPSTYVDNAAGRRAVNELAQLRFDPSQYLNDAQRAYNQANYQINRNAGYGAGAQAIMRNANLQSYLNSLSNIRTKEQEANNSYRAAYADALAKYGAAEQEAMIRDNVQRFNWQQQQNAAKEYYMDTYRKNRLTAMADAAHDVMSVKQFDRSQSYQDRMLDLYGRQVSLDEQKLANEIAQQAEAKRAASNRTRYISSNTPYYTEPDAPIGTKVVWTPGGMSSVAPFKCGKSAYKCGKPGYLLGTEGLDGLVDTRSDTTQQGYHEGAVPVGAGYGPAAQGPMELMTLLTESPATLNNPYLQTGEAPTPSRDWAKINEILRARKAASDATKLAKMSERQHKEAKLGEAMRALGKVWQPIQINQTKAGALTRASKTAEKAKKSSAARTYKFRGKGNYGALTANDFE